MTGLEMTQAVLAELTLLHDTGQVTVREGGDAWRVVLSDGWPFDIFYEQEPCRLVIAAPVCTIPIARREKVHAALLAYNSLWWQTGGLRTGLEEDGETAVLLLDLPMDQVRVSNLGRVMSNMTRIASAWRELVGNDLPGAGLLGGPPAPHAPMSPLQAAPPLHMSLPKP